MTQTDDRPDSKGHTNDEKTTDRRGKHPSDGLAGKIQATQSAAPEDATWREVLRVAWKSFEDDLDPSEVWAGRRNEKLSTWGDAQ